MTSIRFAPSELPSAPVAAVVVFATRTLPAVLLIAVAPVASGAGKSVVPPVPAASATK